MTDKLPLGRIEDILVEIRDKIGTTGTGGASMLEEAKQYTDEQVAAALQEAKDYVDAHAQAQNPHNITPALIGAETPAGAQAKANQAEANAKAYADSLVENMETVNGAQAKADAALNSAKSYADTVASAAEASAKSYADSLAQGLETPAGAQAKADAALSSAKAYADGLVEGLETQAGAQAKANAAESNAKAYTLSLLSGNADVALTGIVLTSPGGKLFELTVDDDGNLITVERTED